MIRFVASVQSPIPVHSMKLLLQFSYATQVRLLAGKPQDVRRRLQHACVGAFSQFMSAGQFDTQQPRCGAEVLSQPFRLCFGAACLISNCRATACSCKPPACRKAHTHMLDRIVTHASMLLSFLRVVNMQKTAVHVVARHYRHDCMSAAQTPRDSSSCCCCWGT